MSAYERRRGPRRDRRISERTGEQLFRISRGILGGGAGAVRAQLDQCQILAGRPIVAVLLLAGSWVRSAALGGAPDTPRFVRKV